MAERLIPEPYAYPSTRHIRRHGPSGWNDYHRYRPWLRDEFAFRCVYCLEREVWRDMRTQMHIDHFQPQKLRPNLAGDYSNLFIFVLRVIFSSALVFSLIHAFVRSASACAFIRTAGSKQLTTTRMEIC